MLLVRRNVDVIAGFQVDGVVFELQPCRSLQHQNPFVLILIEPKAFW